MCQQSAARRSLGCELPGAEDNIVACRVGMRVDVARRLRRGVIVVNSHARKVVAESLLHVLAQIRMQRSSGACQCAFHAVGRRAHRVGRGGGAALNTWRRRAGCDERRTRHLGGYSIGFEL